MINPEDAGPTLNIRSAFVSPSFELFHYFLPFLSPAQRCLHQAARGEGDSDTCYNANKNSKFVCFFSTLYVVSDFVIASEA